MSPRKEVLAEGVELWLGDSREVVPMLGNFEAVVTDPPYGINANNQTLGSGRKEFSRGGDWDKERPEFGFLLPPVVPTVIWGGNYFTDKLPTTNDWLVWHKVNDNLSFSECELAWTNSGKQVRHLSHHWGGEKKQHPTQKPLAVMKWCISFIPDHLAILDPFMGSGTTGVAAVSLGRKFTGIEIDPGYFDIAVRRIEAALKQPDMFIEPPKPIKQEALQL
jgi:site-specific DNA-methyltransferase (adenine-specific)